ncbi:MAG: hypothetical protein ACR2OD_01815 [Gaiellaceae bacterium]
MVGRATALLALLLALALYYGASSELPELEFWTEIAFVSAIVVPAVFGLVLIGLPLRLDSYLGAGAVSLAVATAVLTLAGLDVAANFTKFATVVALGWWAVRVFEHAWWVALVAVIIVPVDVLSVLFGPTRVIIEDLDPQVFNYGSITFPVPGFSVGETGLQLGLPDVLFFALFLGACAQFALRIHLTWLLMAFSFGGTIALAILIDRDGFAALPLLSAAFLLANADLIVRRLLRER